MNFPVFLAERGRGLLVTVFTGVTGTALGASDAQRIISDTNSLQETVWIISIVVGILTIAGFILKIITWVECQIDKQAAGTSSLFGFIKRIFKGKNKS